MQSPSPVAGALYRLAARAQHPELTVVRVGTVGFGQPEQPVVMAGPCAVESEEQIETIARRVAAAGARFLRGGAFKPRTSPYSFQGLGLEGLPLLRDAAHRHGLLLVTEVMDSAHLAAVAEHADLLQIGSRTMGDYALLTAVGKLGRPVLLKRGSAATLDEFLGAAEYLLVAGTPDVILCERGVRGFDRHTRNLLDLSAVPVLKTLTHLPVVVDPSHGCGRRDAVPALARAALAAGADGLLVEVAPEPDACRSDGPQSLSLDAFDGLMGDVKALEPLLEKWRTPGSADA